MASSRSVVGDEAGPDDKLVAREHVAQLLGPGYVPRRLLVTNRASLPWAELPDRFVVSATHGSGMTIIVEGKHTIDRQRVERIVASWLARDHGRFMSEPMYQGIVPQLLIDEKLCDEAGTPPVDYKFFCFGGSPMFVQVVVGMFGRQRRLCLDMDWRSLPFNFGPVPRLDVVPPRPVLFDEMQRVAHELSSRFDFVRIDVYQVGSRVIFGEYTSSPVAGICGSIRSSGTSSSTRSSQHFRRLPERRDQSASSQPRQSGIDRDDRRRCEPRKLRRVEQYWDSPQVQTRRSVASIRNLSSVG